MHCVACKHLQANYDRFTKSIKKLWKAGNSSVEITRSSLPSLWFEITILVLNHLFWRKLRQGILKALNFVNRKCYLSLSKWCNCSFQIKLYTTLYLFNYFPFPCMYFIWNKMSMFVILTQGRLMEWLWTKQCNKMRPGNDEILTRMTFQPSPWQQNSFARFSIIFLEDRH